MEINYYVLDEIKSDGIGGYDGYLNGYKFEVFPCSESDFDGGDFNDNDFEIQLTEGGFVKCDAPNFDETMLVAEYDIKEAQEGVLID